MALGVPAKSSVLVVLVGPTLVGATVPIGGLLSPNYVSDRPSQTRDYHGQASFVVNGKRVTTATVPCDYEVLDSGQKILHDAFVAATTIFYKYLPDGTNGEAVAISVSHEELTSPDANGVQQISWNISQVADPTVVGTGFSQ